MSMKLSKVEAGLVDDSDVLALEDEERKVPTIRAIVFVFVAAIIFTIFMFVVSKLRSGAGKLFSTTQLPDKALTQPVAGSGKSLHEQAHIGVKPGHAKSPSDRTKDEKAHDTDDKSQSHQKQPVVSEAEPSEFGSEEAEDGVSDDEESIVDEENEVESEPQSSARDTVSDPAILLASHTSSDATISSSASAPQGPSSTTHPGTEMVPQLEPVEVPPVLPVTTTGSIVQHPAVHPTATEQPEPNHPGAEMVPQPEPVELTPVLPVTATGSLEQHSAVHPTASEQPGPADSETADSTTSVPKPVQTEVPTVPSISISEQHPTVLAIAPLTHSTSAPEGVAAKATDGSSDPQQITPAIPPTTEPHVVTPQADSADDPKKDSEDSNQGNTAVETAGPAQSSGTGAPSASKIEKTATWADTLYSWGSYLYYGAQ